MVAAVAHGNPVTKAKAKAKSASGPVKVTKQWLVAHVEMMRELDWVTRHQLFRMLLRLLPEHCKRLALLLSPDELLTGKHSGTTRRANAAIRLPDVAHRAGRQMLITDFFNKVSVPSIGQL